MNMLSLLRRKAPPQTAAPEQPALPGAHDCALAALSKALPELPRERLAEAFLFCSQRWPHGGVRHEEFNVALRYLGLFDRFRYRDDDGQTTASLRERGGTHIALVHRHYTVVASGAGPNRPRHAGGRGERVYCSWELVA